MELRNGGIHSWLDQHATEITEDEMEKNVIKARKILVFLSKDVFERNWVHLALRTAIKLQKIVQHHQQQQLVVVIARLPLNYH
jgi:hypothetical protein